MVNSKTSHPEPLALPRSARLIGAIAVFIGCGTGGSGGSGGPSGGSGSGMFTGNAGTYGTFSCPAGTTGFSMEGHLQIYCSVPADAGADSGMTLAALSLTGYHGSGTYSFMGSDKDSASQFDMTIGNTLLDSVANKSPEPTTSCTVTVTGPATLEEGDEVMGHIHCTDIAAAPLVSDDGGFQESKYITFDGDFDAFDTF